jgi:BirA family biotin operon repressor/biotin-[acetyl-CoA-carboxylase] ligase
VARGRDEWSVVVAHRQTAGRGQRGSSWVSEAGENLTFSVALEPVFMAPVRQFLLSETVALAVSDALAGFGIEAKVKWPNDIYVGDGKVAGILIENDVRGAALSRSIVGVGLNVNQTKFPPELPNPVSMRGITGIEYDMREVLDAVLNALSVRYEALKAGVSPDNDYARSLYRMGEEAWYALPDGTRFEGVVRGVLPTGELAVELSDGCIRYFLFKEVEFLL